MSNRLEITIQKVTTSIAPSIAAFHYFADKGGETIFDLATLSCLGPFLGLIVVGGVAVGATALYLRHHRNIVMEEIQTLESRVNYGERRSQTIFTDDAARREFDSLVSKNRVEEIKEFIFKLEVQNNPSLSNVLNDAEKYLEALTRRNVTASLNPQRIKLAGKKFANRQNGIK